MIAADQGVWGGQLQPVSVGVSWGYSQGGVPSAGTDSSLQRPGELGPHRVPPLTRPW